MSVAFILWLVFAFFSFGFSGLGYIWTRYEAKKPWRVRTAEGYRPKVSIIVPIYNESQAIGYKLKNLAKLDYPTSSTQMIFIDSGSTDSTVEKIQKFIKEHPNMNIRVLVENERRGKSSALNRSLRSCDGDVIIVSDADCFWPSNILIRSLPYLADPDVGAISGPKKLLNPEASATTRSEDAYLKSMNMVKLGESKSSSTMLFEGGFSGYKKEALDSFDPYFTGSDDCGTVIKLLEKGYKAIMVQEAGFFTTFPNTWKGKIAMKARRANQLVRLLKKYAILLLKKKIRIAKPVIAKNVFMYLVSPIVFLPFAATTVYLVVEFPLAVAALLILLVPRVRTYLAEVTLNYVILVYAIFSSLSKKRFAIWSQSEDRALLEEQMLSGKGLI
jgi:biofilm PGA synthesis N-glycosyltransferase PgaC